MGKQRHTEGAGHTNTPPLPHAFVRDMRSMLGDEAEALCSALGDGPVTALRVNALRSGALEAARPFIDGPVTWAEGGFYIKEGTRPGAHPLHAAGAFYIQDASAMAPVTVLDIRPGQRVLDLCAAPGGKSTQIAARLRGEGVLVANEPVPSRAQVLCGNLERMGVANALVMNETPERLAERWPEAFDAVLVDAPCSGEGMFRRVPAARGEWSEAGVAGCAARQLAILDSAARMLRPGGRLVYSTCTFNRAENEGVAEAFLCAHADFETPEFSLPGVGESSGGTLRLWPHRVMGEGQCVALLVRRGDASGPDTDNAHIGVTHQGGQDASASITDNLYARASYASAHASRGGKAAIRKRGEPPHGGTLSVHALLNQMVPGVLSRLPSWIDNAQLTLAGDVLIARSPLAPDTDGLRLLMRGLALLTRKGKTAVPHHALAMAAPELAARALDLDDDRARAVLAGHPIASPGENGYLLLTTLGQPLGWGKRVEGMIKNHIPKGLRIMYNGKDWSDPHA